LLYSKEALEKSIVEALRNQIVVTGYSNEVYTIVGVDFSLLPTSYRGKQSFVDLLRDRFKVEIGNLEQPMLIAENEHQDEQVLLIPECCYLTGLSAE